MCNEKTDYIMTELNSQIYDMFSSSRKIKIVISVLQYNLSYTIITKEELEKATSMNNV